MVQIAPALLERLAEQAHDSWAGWTRWMLEKWSTTHASGETFVDRWTRQCATRYADLSEAEKESDREEARQYLALIRCGTCAFWHRWDPKYPRGTCQMVSQFRRGAAARLNLDLGELHTLETFGCLEWRPKEKYDER